MIALALAVGAVLLIAVVNVGNLLLVRVVSRRNEFGVRAALGASRWQLIRSVLLDGLFVSLVGALFGSALAWILLRAGLTRIGWELPRLEEATFDFRTLAAVVVLASSCALISGSIALLGTKGRMGESLSSRRLSRRGSFALKTLTGVETVLAFLVLTAAGLVGESLRNVKAVDPGFVADSLFVFRFEDPSDSSSIDRASRLSRLHDLRQDLAQLPGVDSVAVAATRLPLEGSQGTFELYASPTHRESGDEIRVTAGIVSPHYFQTLGIPLVAGRDFSSRESWEDAHSVIVGEEFARRYGWGSDSVGRELVFKNGEVGRVVGVVGDVRHRSLETSGDLAVYVPWGERSNAVHAVAMRFAEAAPTLGTVRQSVAAHFPGAAVFDVSQGADLVVESIAQRRALALATGCFAVLALILSVAGVFAATATSLDRARADFAIRSAIGASPGQLSRAVMKQGLRPVALGIAVGWGVGLATAGLWQGLLFGVRASEPSTLAMMATLLLGVAILAVWPSARRAARVDPVEVLRAE